MRLFNMTGKMELHPRKEKVSRREKRERSIALWTATFVCLGMYYLTGAGGWMLGVSLATYLVVKVLLQSGG